MKRGPLAAGLVSLAFGIALALCLDSSFLSEVRIATFSSIWPTSTGTVLDTRTFGLGGKWSTHRATVTYTYDASGRTYKSSQVLCECVSSLAADEALHKFPIGKQTSVFYDPISPSLSVVQLRGFDAAFLMKWGLAITAVLLFTAVLPIALWILSSNSAPHRDGREASHSD